MESGMALVVVVCLLGLVALVLVGSAKPDGRRIAAGGEPQKAKSPSVGPAAGAVVRRELSIEDEALLATKSGLVIPPPDEARIEAVAPKNDRQMMRR